MSRKLLKNLLSQKIRLLIKKFKLKLKKHCKVLLKVNLQKNLILQKLKVKKRKVSNKLKKRLNLQNLKKKKVLPRLKVKRGKLKSRSRLMLTKNLNYLILLKKSFQKELFHLIYSFQYLGDNIS